MGRKALYFLLGGVFAACVHHATAASTTPTSPVHHASVLNPHGHFGPAGSMAGDGYGGEGYYGGDVYGGDDYGGGDYGGDDDGDDDDDTATDPDGSSTP